MVTSVAAFEILITYAGKIIADSIGEDQNGIACVINENNIVLGCSDPYLIRVAFFLKFQKH